VLKLLVGGCGVDLQIRKKKGAKIGARGRYLFYEWLFCP
jgi:hypothetical protein